MSLGSALKVEISLFRGAVTRLTFENAARDAMLDDVTVGRPRPQQFRRQQVHFGVTIIAYDKSFLRIEHAQAFAHVVDRGVQPEFLLLQFPL